MGVAVYGEEVVVVVPGGVPEVVGVVVTGVEVVGVVATGVVGVELQKTRTNKFSDVTTRKSTPHYMPCRAVPRHAMPL